MCFRAGSDDLHRAVGKIFYLTGNAETDSRFFGGLPVKYALHFSLYQYGYGLLHSVIDQVHDLFQVQLVGFVKLTERFAVHVQYCYHFLTADHRYHDL